MDDIRLDKYLWAVRVFKTRSDAADAIRNNKVTVNGSAAKPSREVKVGDVIAVRKMQVTYSYRVLDLVSSRQPAKNVPLYCLNITPQEELDKLSIPRETIFVFRDRGTGRPTKKERRELDGLMDGIYYDGDEEASMSGVSPYELLTFASSSVAAALGALLLGLRIPGGQALGTLRTARGYLALSCFIWAAAGFAGTFLHPDVGDKP